MEARTYMLSSLEVCNRLEEFTKQPTNKPLISQAQRQMTKLVAETRRLADELINQDIPTPDHAGENADRPCYVSKSFLRTLSSVDMLISRGFALLDFCLVAEQDGDDGALNAAFSSLYILQEPSVELGSVRHLIVKMERLSQEVDRLSSIRFGSDAASFKCRWDARSRIQLAAFILDHILQGSCAFFNRFIPQFAPRYVHIYDSQENSPYIVDSLVLPTTGSYAIVQKVDHSRTQESFAQKTFTNVFSKSHRKKILREIGILELCIHRNIVQLIEAFEIKGDAQTIHIVMTPWAPYTLLNFLLSYDADRKKNCPWFEPNRPNSDVCIYRIMYEMADAIAYLHRQSIKHKDIKPDNILLHGRETVHVMPVITDVGVSKIYRRGASTNYTDSSWQYLSPEQLKSEESSLKADIWQLGCCFAMLLAVARGGRSALYTLWSTFDKTDENCTCNIAQESGPFLKTLRNICVPGNQAQEHAHGVVSRMLELHPSSRPDVEIVRMELEELPLDYLTQI
ncbi:MAG: hypothetical protein Q9160_007901 [Pyrenula sp. 1 TL-2023]